MAKTVNFEKIRKRRRLMETVKRFLALALIVSAVGGIILLNNIFVEYGLSNKVSDLIGSVGGGGFPVDTPGGYIRDIKSVGNGLAVLSDANLSLYNNKGKVMSNIQQMSSKTVMAVNGSRVLTFDVGARGYQLHTASRTVSAETENGILAADLGGSNEYAIVTASRQYVAEVAVYKSPSESIFHWYSPDNHVTGVSLAPKGNMMAVSCIMAEDGMIRSSVALFHLGVEEKLAETDLPGSLIMGLDFYEADRIGVLTDREYLILDSRGKKVSSYPLGDNPPAGFASYGRLALIRTEYKEARTSEIILLDEECKEKARLTAGNNIKGMVMGHRRIYILDDTGIESFDHNLNSMDKLELRGILNIHLSGDKLYYCTAEEICLL